MIYMHDAGRELERCFCKLINVRKHTTATGDDNSSREEAVTLDGS
jgi:hypothetical protein